MYTEYSTCTAVSRPPKGTVTGAPLSPYPAALFLYQLSLSLYMYIYIYIYIPFNFQCYTLSIPCRNIIYYVMANFQTKNL